jgi:hypothetical protein
VTITDPALLNTSTSLIAQRLTIRVEYETTGGKAVSQKFELDTGDSPTLQLRKDLVNSSTVEVSVPETLVLGTDFDVVGETIQLTSATPDELEVIANYASDPKIYFGGEQVLTPVLNLDDEFVLEEVLHADGDLVFDVYDPSRSAVLDPFDVQLTHESNDPVLQFNGDPALHYRGEIQRYLGGEPTLDENGDPVLNFDGGLFLHLPGQVKIHDRRDLVFVPDFMTFGYTAATTMLDLNTGTLNIDPNSNVPGWALDFQRSNQSTDPLDPSRTITLEPDRVVAVIASSDMGIFALERVDVSPSDNQFSFDPATGEITLGTITHPVADSTTGVSLEVSLALLAFHETGGNVQKRYFGDEEVQVGQPVVQKAGDNFAVLELEDGTVVTYTDDENAADVDDSLVYYVNSKGEIILHQRGEPVFLADGTPDTYAQGDPMRYVGNEPQIYFGGEQAYYNSSEPVQVPVDVHRVSLEGVGDQSYTFLFTNEAFPADLDTTPVQPTITTDNLELFLGGDGNLFTIVDTQEGATLLDTGGGSDLVAVRAISGDTTIRTQGGTDTVHVGSEAGLFETPAGPISFVNVNGTADLIDSLLTVEAGDPDAGDVLTVDDITDTSGDTGVQSLTLKFEIRGIFGPSGALDYDGFERADINLGDGGNVFSIQHTHGSEAVDAVTNLTTGDGDDFVNVETISGTTTV